jgi:hypothetical protein
MPAPAGAPAWAAELARSYESGAHGQFILYGNVHDRLAVDGRLVNLAAYLEDELLRGFQVVFAYDLGNGLRIERGGDVLEQWARTEGVASLPREPLDAVSYVSRFVRYLGNLRALERGGTEHVACIVRDADHVLPADGTGHEHGAAASLVRDWGAEHPYTALPFASLLIAENLNDLAPLVGSSPRAGRIRVALPDAPALAQALEYLRATQPAAFATDTDSASLAAALAGTTIAALESMVKARAHARQPFTAGDVAAIKKALVERDAGGLIEFMTPRRTLADYQGQEALKTWLRQDIALWRAGDTKALPMGYLFCGPVGTGKTYLVECVAGEAGVPVVKLKNFRDRWVGSSEGNLEKIFRLVRALGQCMVFIDEADQALGRRDGGSGDSGLSGRLYSMIAQEMSDSANRGRIMWLLASSRPDLIEVDLKRPGRIDVKVPLLPTATPGESAALLGALARRYELALEPDALQALQPRLPLLLTPGATEALVVKAYRLARTQSLGALAALEACLQDYQNPVPADVLEFQMRIAIREATDLGFVPPSLRHYADERRP